MRSIEVRRSRRRDGTELITYRVRWTGPDGRRLRRSFDALAAAVAFRDELDRRAALVADGPAARATMTVAECYAVWMREHVVPECAARTRAGYVGVWQRHLVARVGGELAIDVRPRHVKQWRGEMLAEGVGVQTVRKALQTLGAIFAHALELDIVEVNPVPQIRKPRTPPVRQVAIVDIATVEAMRRATLFDAGSPLTAIAISLGYLAGLRPGEWRALRWRDVGDGVLVVRDSTNPDGSLRGLTKTRADRAIDLWPALAADLSAWRALTPFADDHDPVVPNGRRGHWSDEEYKRWSKRTFRRCAHTAGWPDATPNKLRHLHASLLIKEGRLDSREIAERMGHSVEMLERRYAHEIREYRGRRIDIEDEINRARYGTPRARLRQRHPGRTVA